MGVVSKIQSRGSVLGIDASTKTVAFAIIADGDLTSWGEIRLGDGDLFHRLAQAKSGLEGIINTIDVTDVNKCYIESAVKINNIKTTINLSYMYGIIIATVVQHNIPVHEVTPITWQNYIGNKSFSAVEKAELKKQYPGASRSLLYNKMRAIRKQRTMDWVKNTYGIEVESDNISDAIGIVSYGAHHG